MASTQRFEPVPFKVVSEPRQLKALADPLRVRILHILANQEATNQQLAALLGESQAKTLHHVRFLLDADLIALVEERIRGGNVEKYYRARARMHGFRPGPAEAGTFAAPVAGAVLESVTQEVAASIAAWPEQVVSWETRRARLTAARVAEFDRRLLDLIAEFWGELDALADAEADGDLMAFASAVYRFPGEAG